MAAAKLFEPRNRVIEHDLATMQNLHAIADGFDFRQYVRGQYQAVRATQILDQRSDLANLIGIQPDRGLIKNDHVGFVNDCLGNPHSLLVTLGQRANQASTHVAQAATILASRQRLVKHIFPDFVQAASEAQVFVDFEFPVQGRHFGQIANARLRLTWLLNQINAANADLSRRGGEIAGQHLHGGGLARSVGTEQAKDFTTLELQGNIAHCAITAERAR